MCRNRVLAVAFTIVAFRLSAHERPVVNTAVVISSGTIAERLEANPARRDAAVGNAQRIIAQSVAARLNDVFGFVQWKPAHEPGAAVATLTVTVTQAANNYDLSYERVVSGERKVKGSVDWGTADPLFKPSEERPLGNAVRLGRKVAEKVAAQMGGKKRWHVMEAFLSHVPLCHQRPDVEAEERTFVIHVPLDVIKAARESKLEIEFWAMPMNMRKEKEGWLHLSAWRSCSGCTLGLLKWFKFQTIELKEGEWHDDIGAYFGDRYKRSMVYMLTYRSTDDSSAGPLEED